jgi:hypothetical protein
MGTGHKKKLGEACGSSKLHSGGAQGGRVAAPADEIIPAFASMRFGADQAIVSPPYTPPETTVHSRSRAPSCLPQVHKHEGPALKAALASHGIDLFVAAPLHGQDISSVVFTAIEKARIFVAMATADYAEDTGNPASTNKELQYYQSKHKQEGKPPPLPIKMLRSGEKFDTSKKGVILADVLFNSNAAYQVWPVGSTRKADGSCTVPQGLVDAIVAAARSGGA